MAKEDYRYAWIATTTDGRVLDVGHDAEQEKAVEKAKAVANRLRAEEAKGWCAGVQDMFKPTFSQSVYPAATLTYPVVYLDCEPDA